MTIAIFSNRHLEWCPTSRPALAVPKTRTPCTNRPPHIKLLENPTASKAARRHRIDPDVDNAGRPPKLCRTNFAEVPPPQVGTAAAAATALGAQRGRKLEVEERETATGSTVDNYMPCSERRKLWKRPMGGAAGADEGPVGALWGTWQRSRQRPWAKRLPQVGGYCQFRTWMF